MNLTYQGARLASNYIQIILKKAAEYHILPSLLLVQLHFESGWGNSAVAKADNNLSGMSMPFDEEHLNEVKRPSGVIVTKGSPRPQNEGGYYYHYRSIEDFIIDWTYLLRPNGIYRVSGRKDFNQAVKGLFQVGGAKYDYAASGYESYLKGMVARRQAINQANNGYLDQLDKGGKSMAITAQNVLNVARKYLGVRKGTASHQALINAYNKVQPRPLGYAVTYQDDWCDAFVTAVADEAGASSLIGRECGVERHKNIFKQKGIWHQLQSSGNTYKPQPGDVVIFQWNNQRTAWAHHIGYVESVSGSNITTIEGNTTVNGVSQVARRTYHQYALCIQGYARPKYGASQPSKRLSNQAVAKEALQGKWGNGEERVKRLSEAGYDPKKVQDEVNKLLRPISFNQLVDEVVAGKHGNGEDRIKAIRRLGHDPVKIQEAVNQKLKTNQTTIQVAKEQAVGGDKPKTGQGQVVVDGVIYQITLKEK